jgi:hypothetical protein
MSVVVIGLCMGLAIVWSKMIGREGDGRSIFSDVPYKDMQGNEKYN